MPDRSVPRAVSATWPTEMGLRVAHLWLLKAVGTTLFMVLFFQAYFYVLQHPSRPPWVMPEIWLDRLVPFTPAAFPVYASLWVYVSLPPALIGHLRALLRFGAWVALLCGSCLLVFWLWPTRVPDFGIDWSNYPGLSALKGIDASGNAWPSLHVATAVFSAWWLYHLLRQMGVPRGWHIVNAGVCVAITWSTLATLQHVALDAITGALVGALFAWLSLTPADLRLSQRLQQRLAQSRST